MIGPHDLFGHQLIHFVDSSLASILYSKWLQRGSTRPTDTTTTLPITVCRRQHLLSGLPSNTGRRVARFFVLYMVLRRQDLVDGNSLILAYPYREDTLVSRQLTQIQCRLFLGHYCIDWTHQTIRWQQTHLCQECQADPNRRPPPPPPPSTARGPV